MRFTRAVLINIMVFLIMTPVLFLAKGQANAQIVILAGGENEGSFIFAKELSRLWSHSVSSSTIDMVASTEPFPDRRLEKLLVYQGNFAILDAENAYRLLPLYPQLGVLTVLWPNILHIISRNKQLDHINVANHKTLKVHENSFYFISAWAQLIPEKQSIEDRLYWFGNPSILSNIQDFQEDALILTAPYPVEEFQTLLSKKNHKLLPLIPILLKQLQTNYPWVQTMILSKNTYPHMNSSIELPVSYPVLVGRNDLSVELAKSLLDFIFLQKSATNTHLLFLNLDSETNRIFRKNFNFHPAAKEYFEF